MKFFPYFVRKTYFFHTNFRFYLFIIILYALTFAVVLPVVCMDWAYSQFYFKDLSRNSLEERAVKLNDLHIKETQMTLAHEISSNMFDFYQKLQNQKRVDFVIVIVTIPRVHKVYQLKYLTQTFVKVHTELQKAENIFSSRALFICDTYAGPGNHTEAIDLESYIPVHHRFLGENTDSRIEDNYEKEKDDYVYCMDIALSLNPKYILILEDDAVLVNNFFYILNHIVDYHVESFISQGELFKNTIEWAYLKLYYPERWQGYEKDLIKIIELIAVGLLVGPVFLYVAMRISKKNLLLGEKLLAFCLGLFYAILLVFIIGRQYFLDLKRISKYTYNLVSAPNCCSPAILYPEDKARKLNVYLKATTCHSNFPIDFAMDAFAKENSYSKYLVEPNLVKHIGMYSSFKGSKRPQEYIF